MNKRNIIVVLVCLVLVFALGACGSSNGDNNESDKAETLPADVLARVADVDITKDQVAGTAAYIAIRSGLNYDDLTEDNIAAKENVRLIDYVNAEAIRASQPDLVSDDEKELLKGVAENSIKELEEAGVDVEKLKITADLLTYYSVAQLYQSKYKTAEAIADGGVDAAYSELRAKTKILWNDSLTIDKATGLPTVD